MKTADLIPLYTEEGESLSDASIPFYPRPTMVRDSFLSLNGEWELSVTDRGKPLYNGTIRVPFPPESLLSGVDRMFPEAASLLYEKEFTLPEGFLRSRVLLYFDAVDQIATVRLNGVVLGTHIGGYDRFSFDITPYLSQKNTLTVTVLDRLSDAVLPYGKQKRKRGGMWYTPVSGIWQSVWLESVPTEYVHGISTEASLTEARIAFDGIKDGVLTLTESGESFPVVNGRVTVSPRDVHLWSPETPYLYYYTLQAGDDEIRSYFALRTVSVGKDKSGTPRLFLNGNPYFFHGVLDQGYFPDGLLTPASPSLYTKDIEAMKALGFNMLRKHIKLEAEYFYYECDRLGMAVFQDMVNNGRYSFLFDTALPTLGLKKLDDRRRHRKKEQREAFLCEAEKTVAAVKHHPSVVYYTIFNEGWGQFSADEVTGIFRTLDQSRIIDATSGWFWQKDSDVDSLHVYFKPVRITPSDRPIVLSEFGGYSYKPAGHVSNTKKTYGYRLFSDREKLEAAVAELYRNEVIPAVKDGLSADVYTQVSDIEDETNGFLSYDRKVLKVDPDLMQKIAAELFSEFQKHTKAERP